MGEEHRQRDEISVVELYADQKVIISRLDSMQDDVEHKHKENRNSIHDLRGGQQKIIDDIWKLKVKIAGYSVLGGVLTTIVTQIVRVAFEKSLGK